jgi:hypothetical protein
LDKFQQQEIATVEATLWHKGRWQTYTWDLGGITGSFSHWPDRRWLYDQFGRKDQSEEIHAFLDSMDQYADPSERLMEYLEQENADPIAAYMLAYLLRRTYSLDALRPVTERGWADLKPQYPGQLIRLGWFPDYLAAANVAAGRPGKAEEIIDRALEEATRQKAWAALWVLRSRRCLDLLRTDPDAALKYFQAHRPTVLLAEPYMYSDVGEKLALALAAHDRIDDALELVDSLPATQWHRELESFLRQQEQYTGQTNNTSEKPHEVLVQYIPEYKPFIVHWKSSTQLAVGQCPLPGRLECEFRMKEPPYGAWMEAGSVGVGLDTSAGAFLHIYRSGQFCRRTNPAFHCWSPVWTSPLEWNAVRIEKRLDETLIHTNDYLHSRVLHPALDSRMAATLIAAHCTAEYRHIRLYAYSNQQVDNDKLAALFEQVHHSRLEGNLDGYCRAVEGLLAILDKVPEAEETCRQLRLRRDLFTRVTSDKGLLVSSNTMLESDCLYEGHGTWEANGDKLIGTKCGPTCLGTLVLEWDIPLPRNLEITGLLRIENPGPKTYTEFIWNAGTGCPNTEAIFWPGYQEAQLGGPWNRSDGEVHKVDFSTPLPFCTRSRDDKAALFIRTGARPDRVVEGMRTSADRFMIWTGRIKKDTRLHVYKLRIRHLADDIPLDKPVRMPRLDQDEEQDDEPIW